MASDLPLPTLFARALHAASKAHDLSTVRDETQVRYSFSLFKAIEIKNVQELIRSALTDLRSLKSRIATLSLFSSNESLEDISTRDLVYLVVPFVSAELQGRVKTTEHSERMIHLKAAQQDLKTFVDTLDSYKVLPAEEREIYSKKTSDIRDPAKRRELKIKQYQKEKETRTRIEVCHLIRLRVKY